MNLDYGDLRSLLSIGSVMGGYLDIAQVYSKGSPRRLFLINMMIRKLHVYDI